MAPELTGQFAERVPQRRNGTVSKRVVGLAAQEIILEEIELVAGDD